MSPESLGLSRTPPGVQSPEPEAARRHDFLPFGEKLDAYDAAGRITSIQSPIDPSKSYPTQTAYADDHTWVRVSRGGVSTWTCVDGFGRTKATIATAGLQTGPSFVRTDTEYDGLGRVAFTSLPYETAAIPSSTSATCPTTEGSHPGTRFLYDGAGRLTTRTNPDGTLVTMAYPEASPESWVKVTDENGHQTRQTFEATGSPANARLSSFTDAAGKVTSYAYDDYGNLTTLTSPSLTTAPGTVMRRWIYDTNNRLDHQIQPESGTTTYHYDGFGRVSSQTDAPGRQSTNTYDDANRLTDIATSPTQTPWFHAEYDEWGDRVVARNINATSAGDVAVTSTFVFDAVHRLGTRTDTLNAHTFTSAYDYDGNDRLTGVTYPSRNHVRYQYLHEVLNGVDDPDRTVAFATNFVFHPSGGLSSYTTGNGVVHTIGYDPDTYRVKVITGGGGLDLAYDYWPNGNVKTITDPRPNPLNPQQTMTSGFVYDAVDRLTDATGPWGSLHWDYDEIGNRTRQTKNGVETTYAYTTTNRLEHTTTSGQTETFGYNDLGLLTSDARGSLYHYNPANLQRQANLAAGGSVTYVYDADGQRIWKTFGSDVHSTYYLSGPLGVLSEFEGAAGQIGWSVDYIYAAGRLVATTKPPTGEWRTLTVTHQGEAGTVRSAPAGLDCDATCAERFTRQTVVTLAASPGAGQTFSGWSGACSGTGLTTTVTMTGDLTCVAWFSTNPRLTLTNAASGTGTMATDPAGLSCQTTCTTGVTPGAGFTLIAAPDPGSRFAGWSGDADCADGAVTMGASRSCTATFTRVFTLTVARSGDGGAESTVTSSPAGIDCGSTCSATYDSGSGVTLTADPAERAEFAGWSGMGCTATTNPITVSMMQARNCTASFIFAVLPLPGCDLGAEQDCRNNGGTWDSEICECQYWWLDPLLIPLDGRHIHLTSVTAGVGFDVNGDGVISSADAVFGGRHRRSRPEGLLWPMKQGSPRWSRGCQRPAMLPVIIGRHEASSFVRRTRHEP